jgi:hypothetical protein
LKSFQKMSFPNGFEQRKNSQRTTPISNSDR